MPFIRNIFTLKNCLPIAGVQVLSYDTEKLLLDAWSKFITQVDPDIIIGYNIGSFNVPYLLKHGENLKSDSFGSLGRLLSQSLRFMFKLCLGT
jgi:DNA polymerase delta subunit 1